MSSSPPVVSGAPSTAKRASGRVRKQTAQYASSPFSGSKRKRGDDENGDAQMPDDYESDEDMPTDEDEPAEEEIRERKKKTQKPKASAPKKPAQKKAKVNGTALPLRRKKAPKKKAAAVAVDAEEVGGLYGQVFASDDSLETVASDWLKSFDEHEAQAMADVINFVLQCAGCGTEVTDHDIDDPDNATNRLTEIQDEYQLTEPTEFPLHRKGKAGVAFKETVSGFVIVLVRSIAARGLLYSDPILLENIEVWLSAMTSAASRAFRHTATVASLSIITSLCEVTAERANEAAAAQRQSDSEKKKTKVNQARVKQLDKKVTDTNQIQEWLEVQIKDWFDTVFIHRYRDIDPVIRKECASALGDWIMILPHVFFDGSHLRYLGWILSDSSAATRAEILKQLQRLYAEADKISGLKTFTERFRERLVEIAISDAETNVRVAGIELLDLLREHGLIEPEDVDAVGRLIYDVDPRVRKTVAKFFAENVNDAYNSRIDNLGGPESLEESLPELAEGNMETPRADWLKFKSLAEMLVNYDAGDDLPSQVERHRGDGGLVLHAVAMESRFTLAADALYEKMEDIMDWQALAGYLLFDHSIKKVKGTQDTLTQLKNEVVLDESEAFVLLEIVSTSVKRHLHDLHESSVSTKRKLTKREKAELSEDQEEAARHLASLIPRLFKKFGDVPNTAAAVLRMESVLNMPSLRGLHEDTATYGAILDDIRKQFMSHGTDDVLGPASNAIQHAKSYTDLEEVTDEKISNLWADVVENLTELLDHNTITVRGATQEEVLRALSNNLLRIVRLSQVSDPIQSLEDSTNVSSDYQGAIDCIIALVQRGMPSSGPPPDPEDAALEDEIAARAAEAGILYLQWKLAGIIRTLTSGTESEISYDELELLATRRDQYVTNLNSVLESRKSSDPICITMAKYILELHTTAVVLKTIPLKPGMRDDWAVLIMSLHDSYTKSIMKVFSAAEKNFARLSGKKLEDKPVHDNSDIDADPMDEDPLSDSEDESDDDEPTQTQASQQRKETKQRRTLFAEQTLCELTRSLIYAIHAGVIDGTSTRKRLERNKLKLGHNYKELCSYLDIGQVEGKKGRGKKAAAKGKAKPATVNGTAKGKKGAKSNAIVAEDETEDEIENADDEEGLRRRGLVDEEVEDEEMVEGDGFGGGGEVESVLGD
ncbi:cohesin complex subunit [Saxophila tyrrhenica]|uniref:Cohesin complex subunit n=1 Tax=Saxophila tyrrhenica TaxID=1690608 RepID=A0AAV9P8B4_9PEZI|nr:cohesin complex subunit [Saxophila tyrrhenica]